MANAQLWLIACYRYWDPELKPEEYSYVDATLAKGYSILTYDRLGTGKSSKADGYNEIAILKELTVLARDGNLLHSSKVTGKRPQKGFYDYKPKKVVHIGHSFGSATTSGLLSLHGNFSDGAILTGFLPNNQSGKVGANTFGFEFAREHDPKRFGDRPGGYAVQASLSSTQQIFLKKGSFEVEALEYAEKIKQTGTVGELSSGLIVQPATGFKGPLQVSQFHLTHYRHQADLSSSTLSARMTTHSAMVIATTPMIWIRLRVLIPQRLISAYICSPVQAMVSLFRLMRQRVMKSC
ncbi:hypothetical protein LB505_009556 [Fusarium chuoi]|nr:hypothetical protein LB505_009556 [Fusarium chuoi]